MLSGGLLIKFFKINNSGGLKVPKMNIAAPYIMAPIKITAIKL